MLGWVIVCVLGKGFALKVTTVEVSLFLYHHNFGKSVKETLYVHNDGICTSRTHRSYPAS